MRTASRPGAAAVLLLMLSCDRASPLAVPAPAPPPGRWSQPYNQTSCEDGGVSLRDLGPLPLLECQAQCLKKPACGYIIHADASDHHCITYATCPTPICRPLPNTGGLTVTAEGYFITQANVSVGRLALRRRCVPSPGHSQVAGGCGTAQYSLFFFSFLFSSKRFMHTLTTPHALSRPLAPLLPRSPSPSPSPAPSLSHTLSLLKSRRTGTYR